MALAGILRFNENASWLNLPGNFFALLARGGRRAHELRAFNHR